MAHEILQQSKIMTAVAQRVTCTMPERMRPYSAEPGPISSFSNESNEIVDSLACQGLAALRNKQPR
jgi:hypothetical protein